MRLLTSTSQVSTPRHQRSRGSQIVSLLLAMSVLFLAVSHVCLLPAQTDEAPNPSEQLVHIPDPALRRALEEALDKSAGADITQAEMAALIHFSAVHDTIRDLTGLEYAINMIELSLKGSPIVNLSPLKTMSRLRLLDLGNCWISDVSPLQGLPRLQKVDLRNNEIVNVSPLTQSPALRTLNLDGNQITDVSPFAKATNPYFGNLYLRYNKITDVSSLADVNVDGLWLHGNPVSDFSPLSDLPLGGYDFDVTPQVTPEGIDIPDPLLRKDIQSRLGIGIGAAITAADMKRLEHFWTSSHEITDFTGLEHAINLRTLKISSRRLSDIGPLVTILKNLAQLRELTMKGYYYNGGRRVNVGQIVDVSPLKQLTQLQMLDLEYNRIADVSPLTGLTQLRKLRLSCNEIVDVSPLRPLMENLSELRLAQNRISDFSPIAEYLPKRNGELVSTHSYDITFQNYVYVPPIPPDDTVDIPDAGLRAALEAALDKNAGDTIMRSELETLTSLDASNRGIRDLTGLKYATNLTALNLTDNQLSDMDPIMYLTQLTRLEYAGNQITGIGISLDFLKNLEYLDISRNLILNVGVLPLEKLSTLKTLNLAGNKIKDVSRLQDLSGLTTLDLAGNNVADVSPLAELTNLNKLYLRDNPASDFSSLYELIPNLEDADFSYQVTELDPPETEPTSEQQTLQGIAIPDAALRAALEAALNKAAGEAITQTDMETLTTLNAKGAGIADLNGLEYAVNLTTLNLRNNRITDLSPLSGLTGLRRLDIRRNSISDFSPISSVVANLKHYKKGNQKTGKKKGNQKTGKNTESTLSINADVNRDNVVDATDMDIVSRYTGQSVSEVESGLYPDVNGDGVVDTQDVLAVRERLSSGP